MATADEVSPSIHFRELDDEFMQKQAKVWLEAVLEERYGDSEHLADLLADGQVLFRVSRLLKELIRASSGGAATLPDTPLDAKGGKYLPYSRVDAFLKICKRLGLPDVDLFTPPDVVEKKDIRRVCFCIRALSKKARASSVQVPDFDKVAHTVAMPTQKVGGLRVHLQRAASQSPPVEHKYKSPRQPQSGGRRTVPSSSPDQLAAAEDEECDPSSTLLDKLDAAESSENNVSYPGVSRCGSEADEAGEQEPGCRRGGGIWLAAALGASALAASCLLLAFKPGRRQSKTIEVKEGDTLSKISRQCGKSSWRELVELNPGLMANPDLIYPAERLKL